MILYGTLYTTANCTEQEKKWAKDLGVEYNPLKLEIADGNIKLKCDYDNINELIQNDELIIPSMITEIEQGTFNGINVKRIVIPGSVKTIGNNAFSNNSSVEEVIIEEGVKTIGESAFMNCSKLKKVIMKGDTVDFLGSAAFRGCSLLSEVTMSNNIKELRSWVFGNSPLDDTFMLPSNLETIYTANFGSSKFKVLILPDNLKSIAVDGNISTNLIKIDTSNNDYFEFDDKNKILYNKGKTKLVCALSEITDVEIEDTVTEICDAAFSVCSKLSSVNIPIKVKTIGYSVWNDNISSITVDKNNVTFKSDSNCLLSKNGETLYRCVQTGTVTLPAGIKKIIRGSFKSSGITAIILPESFEEADNGWAVFPKLTTLKLPKNVKSFNKDSYINVESITIDGENPNFEIIDGNYLISKKEDKTLYWVRKGVTTVNIPVEIKNISHRAFYGCNSAGKNLEIPESVTKIDGDNILESSSFENITLPSTIESINSAAFSAANRITSIVINKPKDSVAGAPWGAPGGDKIITWTGSK